MPIKEVESARMGDFWRWAETALLERYGREIAMGMDKKVAEIEIKDYLLGAPAENELWKVQAEKTSKKLAEQFYGRLK